MEMVNVSDKVETNRYRAKVLLKRFNVNGHTITLITFHRYKQRVAIHSERFRIDCEIETTYDHCLQRPPLIFATLFIEGKGVGNVFDMHSVSEFYNVRLSEME